MQFHFINRLLQTTLITIGLLIVLPAVAAPKDKTTPPGQEKKNDDSGDTGGTTDDGTTDDGTTTDSDTTTEKTTGKPDKETGKPDTDGGILGDIGDTVGDTVDTVGDTVEKTTGNNKGGTVVTGSLDPNSPTIYHFSGDFQLKNNIVIAGHTVVVADGGFDFKNSEIQVGPNSSLTMYVKGDVKLAGNGEINTLAAPASLIVYGTGAKGQAIDVVGNAGISAVVYAPDANFTIKGTSGILGAVIANNISNNGQGSTNKSFNGLNYDEALKDMTLADDAMILEDYVILKGVDFFGGNVQNGTYADFFNSF